MGDVVEIRFKVTGQDAIKKQLTDTKKESEQVVASIRSAGKTVGDRLVLSLQDARKVLVNLGGDTKRFQNAIQQAGVSSRDAAILTRQLTKELNESRRAALGIGTAAKDFAKSIRDGTFQAQSMMMFLEKGRAALEMMKRLGKVKGLEESTEDAIKLQRQFDILQNKLRMYDQPMAFAAYKKTIAETSLLTNIPQEQLVEAVLKSEEKKSMGKRLLDNGGSMLKQFATIGFADDLKNEEIPDYITSQVIQMDNMGITDAKALAKIQGITRQGENLGAISASQIATKGGGVTAQLMRLRGLSGEAGYREAQAMLQKVGNFAGIDGDIEKTVNRSENWLAKIADPEYRKRFVAGVGIDPIRKDGTMRPITEIMKAFSIAETKGRLVMKDPQAAYDDNTKTDPKKVLPPTGVYEIYKDAQAREGHFALRKDYQKLTELEKADYKAGLSIYDNVYWQRMKSYEGQMGAIQVRDANTHLEKLPEKMSTILAASNVTSAIQANHPVMSSIMGAAGEAGGLLGPKARMYSEALVANGFALTALDSSLTADPKVKMHQQQTVNESVDLQFRQKKLEEQKALLNDLQKQVDAREAKVNLQVNVESGMRATITNNGKPVREAAQSGTRKPRKAGQN